MYWYSTVVLIYISLRTNNPQHLFMDLLAICMYSLVKCLFKKVSWPFLNWSVCFVNIFSLSGSCHLISLLVAFKEHKFSFGWNRIYHFFVVCVSCAVICFQWFKIVLLPCPDSSLCEKKLGDFRRLNLQIQLTFLKWKGTQVFTWYVGTFWNLCLWQWPPRKKGKNGGNTKKQFRSFVSTRLQAETWLGR